MLNRFGKLVHIGWSQKEELYLDAIIDMGSQTAHVRELSELTGRSVNAVYMRMRKRMAARELIELQAKLKPCVPVRGKAAIIQAPPSQLRPLTRAELMGGR